MSKEIKKGELKERKMYQKGVANGSQEGKYILSKRAHYRKSVKRSDVIAIGNIFEDKSIFFAKINLLLRNIKILAELIDFTY